MKQYEENSRSALHAMADLPHDWAERIKKLRWLGLDEEAERLEAVVATEIPKEGRRSVSEGPFNTD